MDLTAAYGYRLDWIVSFVAVARHGGFSAAAKASFRAQSRISMHIAELEKAIGVQLFDRMVHPTVLTPEGRALLPHAEEILSHLVSRDAGSFTLAAPRRAPRGVGEPATMLGIEAGPPPCDAPTWTPPSLKEPASRDTSGVVRSGARRSAISR